MTSIMELVFLVLFLASAYGAAVPKVTDSEVEDARGKLIFMAEKMLVLKEECLSFNDVHWNLETSNHFVDTIQSLESVDANPTLVADLKVRASAEKKQVIDKLTSLDTKFDNLRAQIFKINEKLRQATFNEISEHFIQFKTISGEIETNYAEFQSTLAFVISDLELAVLLSINGIDHPNIPNVHTYLQQSKDAANNANGAVTGAEQLYKNAKDAAQTAVDVIVSQTVWKKLVAKRDVSSDRSKDDAQPEDVMQAQSDMYMWIEHLIHLHTIFSRLQNAMRLQLSDSFSEIFRSMRELQVDETTVTSIETDNKIDGQLLEVIMGTLWNTMQNAFPTLNSMNFELNYIDKRTRDDLIDLRKQLENSVNSINSDFNSVLTTIDTNLPVTLQNIRNAVNGLSGDPLIRIYLALQVVEDTFNSNRQDVTSEKVLYDAHVVKTLDVVNKIIDDLCSGLFC